jgi:hypothetical protein
MSSRDRLPFPLRTLVRTQSVAADIAGKENSLALRKRWAFRVVHGVGNRTYEAHAHAPPIAEDSLHMLCILKDDFPSKQKSALCCVERPKRRRLALP